MAEKIKAIQPQITVNTNVEKPYYTITYYDTEDKAWHVGFGSYSLANVVKWLEDEFEVVAETADVVEVVRCKDCAHCEMDYPCKFKDEEAIAGYRCKLERRYVPSEHFCSYGERKI